MPIVHVPLLHIWSTPGLSYADIRRSTLRQIPPLPIAMYPPAPSNIILHDANATHFAPLTKVDTDQAALRPPNVQTRTFLETPIAGGVTLFNDVLPAHHSTAFSDTMFDHTDATKEGVMDSSAREEQEQLLKRESQSQLCEDDSEQVEPDEAASDAHAEQFQRHIKSQNLLNSVLRNNALLDDVLARCDALAKAQAKEIEVAEKESAIWGEWEQTMGRELAVFHAVVAAPIAEGPVHQGEEENVDLQSPAFRKEPLVRDPYAAFSPEKVQR
ncbi:hypothetical protein EIP91_001058 [Steccherinum ochraceum]|uniref:Uncharacterized protein n=1 Tax=Steccherinum ochraceum TaxID=92696 RepID=A0A4R0RIQ9_9APHY|nr:hypothetical protein EIP91_001058 [Steccherinum ochraceum]